MPTITKQGQLPGERLFTGKCNNCKTEFTFKREEARSSPDQRDGPALIIKCPLPGCSTDVWVSP